jgi:thymidylate synthase
MFEKVSTLGEAWLRSLQLVMDGGSLINDDNDILMETRRISFEIESVFIDDIIEKYADKERIILMKDKYTTCGLVGDYKIDYGSYIFSNNGINQVNWVTNRLREKPETKSATIGLHKPGENHLSCLSLIDLMIRDNLLEIGVVYRSQNVFASQPGNLLVLSNIQKDIADELSLKVGIMHLFVYSAHIYESDFALAREVLKKNNRD